MTDTPTAAEAEKQRKRQRLIEPAAQRLQSHAIESLAAVLSPAVLARPAAVSTDTAYRLMGRALDVVRAITSVAGDVTYASEDGTWPANASVVRVMAERYASTAANGGDPRTAIVAALQADVEQLLALSSVPVGRLLDAAAMTSSPVWAGDVRLSGEHKAVGDAIRAARRRSQAAQTEQYRWLLTEAMSQMQQRPQPGMTAGQIITIVHCLLDGAVNRLFSDPDCFGDDPTAFIADAMFRLGMAYAEVGSYADPRMPTDPTARTMFTEIVSAAARLWHLGCDVTVERAATDAGESIESAIILFPTVQALADSTLRTYVAAGGPGSDQLQDYLKLPTLVATLRRLAGAADDMPEAVRIAFDEPADPSVAAELHCHAEAVIMAHDPRRVDSSELTATLIGFVRQGGGGWASVEMALTLLDASPSDRDRAATASEDPSDRPSK